MTNETAKFIKLCRTLHEFAPDKPMAQIFDTATELLTATSRRTGGEKKPRAARRPMLPIASAGST